MFLAVHAALGALAGNTVGSPAAAFSIGVLSHFLADMIPHGDLNVYAGYKSGKKKKLAILYVAADAVATVVLIALIFIRNDYFHPVNVSMGIIGGLLPDFLAGLFEILKPRHKSWYRKLAWFHGMHIRNHATLHKYLQKLFKQFEHDIPLRWGMILQAITLFFLMRRIF